MNEHDLMSCLETIIRWWDENLAFLTRDHILDEPECVAKARKLVDLSRRQNAERAGRIVYTSESESPMRRSDVEETPTHYRIWFSENGKWSKAYRVSIDLERARMFADGWVAGTIPS